MQCPTFGRAAFLDLACNGCEACGLDEDDFAACDDADTDCRLEHNEACLTRCGRFGFMDAIKSILNSEHGLIAILLITGATVLCALGIMPLERWETYSQIIFATFAGSHALIAGATAIANRPDSTAGMVSGLGDVFKSMVPSTPPTRSATAGEIAVAAELKAAQAELAKAANNPEPPKAA